MNFFRINIRKNSWRIAQKILSKKVKQALKRRGGGTGVAMELQKKPQSEPLRKLYCIRFHDTLSEFCLNGFSMDRCQLLWLLDYGKVVGYKVEVPIPDPWMLKEREVLANEDFQVSKSMVEI